MLFSHEMKSPPQVKFLLGIFKISVADFRKSWKLLKATICSHAQRCQFVKIYLLFYL